MDKKLTDIIGTINSGRIHNACESLRNYIYSKQLLPLYDSIQAVSKEYNLLLSFARQGAKDSRREDLFDSITHRLRNMCYDAAILEERKVAPFYTTQSKRLQEYDLKAGSIRSRLEDYVSMMAMAEVDPDIDKSSLIEEHQSYITALFSHLCLSRTWSITERIDFCNLLLSPTIDQSDAAMMISALTLACNAFFDREKWLMFTNIHLLSDDEVLRQRAFVGWAINTHDIGDDERCLQRLNHICQDTAIKQDILLLQKEILYSSNTLKDNEKIKKDILPNILKSKANPLNSIGFEGLDINQDADVDAEIEAMDEVERYYRQIMNMEREGSDVFYSGFAHMKRYAFFYNLSNWFAPFSTSHPELSRAVGNNDTLKDMLRLLHRINLCDSDRYSMALSMQSIVSMLGENMKELAELGFKENSTEEETPTIIRRHYLQDLFRFFNLYPQKHCFRNPFNDIFIISHGFEKTPVKEEMLTVVRTMEKLHIDERLDEVFGWCMNNEVLIDNEEMQTTIARRMLLNKRWIEAKMIFFFLYNTGTQTEEVLRGLAYCFMMNEEHELSAKHYKILSGQHPEKIRYKMCYLLEMTRIGKAHEVINDIFQLNFEASEQNDEQMLCISYRLLAWALLCIGRYEESIRHYNLLKTKNMQTVADIFHQGIAEWLAGNMREALYLLSEWDRKKSEDVGNLYEELGKCRQAFSVFEKTDNDITILCELLRLEQNG